MIIWAVVASILVNVFFTRWLTAKISTLPWLNRLNLINPQAPIVITQREEIRISPEGELREALEKIRKVTSRVGVMERGEFKPIGQALSFTSDGIWITSALTAGGKLNNSYVSLPDGQTVRVTQVFVDKETGVAFLKTPATVSGVGTFAETAKLELGDRLLLFIKLPEGEKYFESYVNLFPERNQLNGVFGFQDAGVKAEPGTIFLNYKGEVLGIWHDRLITAEQIKAGFENYLKMEGKK